MCEGHWRAGRSATLWLTASLTLVLIPHVTRMPAWISIAFAVLALWRIEHVLHGVRLPGRWARALLAIAVISGVLASYGTLFGRNAGVAALTVLAGMKLLEIERLRDAYAATFLGYFLVITNFLYTQDIPTGIYMVAVVVVMTGAMVDLNSAPQHSRVAGNLRLAGALLIQAVPLMLALFILFPRVPGPLWGLPKDAHSARSGLSDTMSPGTISQLSLSDAVAFRVAFDGRSPPPARLYWRGPVLNYTDGRNWTAGDLHVRSSLPEMQIRGASVDYTVTLEPHRRQWIFALDVPASVTPGMRISDAYQLLATSRVTRRTRYRLRSYPGAVMKHLTEHQRRAALALPRGAHPRARELAARWRLQTGGGDAFIDAALDYFRTQPFYYTLRPPLLLGDPVDEFLFGSRRGFCENYASAFTILMRAGGIPARVVTGYQGGDPNPLGNYLIVRQRDAHAWTEVWLGERGWVRVDPTAAVSPQRIELGMDATLPETIGPAAFGLRPDGAIAGVLRGLRHGWDAVNNSWNQWVLGYGPARQNEFLSRFGIDAGDWRTLAGLLAGAAAGLLGAVGLWLMRRRRERDPFVRAYSRFCRRLARLGIERGTSEGPRAFSARIARLRPELRAAADHITGLYVAARYAGVAVDADELRRAVTAFRPRRGMSPA